MQFTVLEYPISITISNKRKNTFRTETCYKVLVDPEVNAFIFMRLSPCSLFLFYIQSFVAGKVHPFPHHEDTY
jgi:hypothetical protein